MNLVEGGLFGAFKFDRFIIGLGVDGSRFNTASSTVTSLLFLPGYKSRFSDQRTSAPSFSPSSTSATAHGAAAGMSESDGCRQRRLPVHFAGADGGCCCQGTEVVAILFSATLGLEVSRSELKLLELLGLRHGGLSNA